MERLPRGRYTKEFKEEAVRLASEGRLAVSEVARRLLIPKNTLDNWLRAKKTGKL
jgi:transposase-like protein